MICREGAIAQGEIARPGVRAGKFPAGMWLTRPGGSRQEMKAHSICGKCGKLGRRRGTAQWDGGYGERDLRWVAQCGMGAED